MKLKSHLSQTELGPKMPLALFSLSLVNNVRQPHEFWENTSNVA